MIVLVELKVTITVQILMKQSSYETNPGKKIKRVSSLILHNFQKDLAAFQDNNHEVCNSYIIKIWQDLN